MSETKTFYVKVEKNIPFIFMIIEENSIVVSDSQIDVQENIKNIDSGTLIEYNDIILQNYSDIINSLFDKILDRPFIDISYKQLATLNKKKLELDNALTERGNNV